MIQRQQPHPAGTFASCSGCRREPRHYVCRGGTSREPNAIRAGGTGDRHQLECSRCDRRTARHATLDDCVADWGANHTQGDLPLPLPTRRNRAA